MATRKLVKQSEVETESALEAGDMPVPKRKKIVQKVTNKNDEEKQIRLPRAAKTAKTEQNEVSNTTSIITKKAKTRDKIPLPPKNSSTPIKTRTKVKSTTAKKTKETKEKNNATSVNAEVVTNVEETETKRTRTKAATKKAGTDADEEPKGKIRGRPKKGAATESAENLEAPAAKKKKLANTEVGAKESKPKTKVTKKKTDEDVDVKSKVSGSKNKTTASNKISDDSDKIEEISTTAKTVKKSSDKVTKTVVRSTRGRKNGATIVDTSKDDDESKVTEESSSPEVTHVSDNENQKQNDQSEVTESVQPLRKGRNLKKKEETVPQKKVPKTRGKGVNRNAVSNEDSNTVLNEEDSDTAKTVKDTQKKTNKENVSTTTTKKGRAKKGTATTIAKNVNGEKVSENSATGENTLNSTEILTSNNNVQKSLEDGNNKKQGSDEETIHAKNSGSTKKLDESVTIKDEEIENNLSTSVHEEER